MVTTLEHGITIHSSAGGAIVQQAEVTNKREKSTVSGMVNGKCEIVKVFDYGETNEFDVTGKGDLTMAAGITSTADLALISDAQNQEKIARDILRGIQKYEEAQTAK